MKKMLVLAALLAALLSPAAFGQSCEQCPSSPCEVATCPSDPDTPVFANVLFDGDVVSLDEDVEIYDGVWVSLTDMTTDEVDEDILFDFEFMLEDENSLGDGFSIKLELKHYYESGGSWVYSHTSPTYDVFKVLPSSYSSCQEYSSVCPSGPCTNGAACSTADWCSEIGACVVSTGACYSGKQQPLCCTARSIICSYFVELHPIQHLRRSACQEGFTCQIKVVHVAELPSQ